MLLAGWYFWKLDKIISLQCFWFTPDITVYTDIFVSHKVANRSLRSKRQIITFTPKCCMLSDVKYNALDGGEPEKQKPYKPLLYTHWVDTLRHNAIFVALSLNGNKRTVHEMTVTMIVNFYEGNELLVPPQHNITSSQISVHKEHHLCKGNIELVTLSQNRASHKY